MVQTISCTLLWQVYEVMAGLLYCPELRHEVAPKVTSGQRGINYLYLVLLNGVNMGQIYNYSSLYSTL